MKTVVGLFDDMADARDVVDDCVDAGIPRNDISIIARDVTGRYEEHLGDYDHDVEYDYDGEDVAEAAAGGAVGGAVVGGLAGVLVGIGAFAIPGLGPVIAAGPLAAGLAGAGIGAAAGGLLGALVEWGIPEEEAEYYAEGVRRGGALVAVKVSDARAGDVFEIMDDHDPVNIERRAEYWREEYDWTGYDAEAEPYTAEELDRYRRAREDWWEDEDDSELFDIDDDDDELFDLDFDLDDDDVDQSAVPFGELEPNFEEHYGRYYVGTDYTFGEYLPAYRYGYILALHPQYRERDWDIIEPEVAERWEKRDNGAWEEFKDAVHNAWHETKEALGLAPEDNV